MFKKAYIGFALIIALSGCGTDEEPPADTTSPNVTAIQVSSVTTTGATVSFNTDEPATAQIDYADNNYYNGNLAYNHTESTSNFIASHSITLSNLSPSTTYHYRISANDAAGNTTTGVDRTFTTLAQDTVAPVLSNPTPATSTVLAAGTTSTTLGITTDEAAQCRYGTTAGTDYGAMPNSFATTGTTAHSTTVNGLSDGTAFSYYVRCQDNAGNANTSDYAIAFAIAAGSVNHPPVLDPIADIIVTEGAAVTFTPTASDVDKDNLTYSYSGWMTSSSYTTTSSDVGTHTVVVTVSDGNGGSDSQNVSVTVNLAPQNNPTSCVNPSWKDSDFTYVYEVGANYSYKTPNDVPWESLAPDSLVKIHWQSTPYRSKWVIGTTGTATTPVVVLGVPDSNGNLPIISGDNATTRTQLDFWSADKALIKIGGASVPANSPAYVTIECLDIRDARDAYSFTDQQGNLVPFDYAAAAIYIERGDHITLRNNLIHNAADGIYSYHNTSELLITGNHIWDNGMPYDSQRHNSYTESIGTTIEFNHYGPLRSGASGNNIKDRSADTVIRYNWIESANMQLDLVDGSAQTAADPRYQNDTFVYGNVIIEKESSLNASIVNYGGDQNAGNDRKGTLHFYHNTIYSNRQFKNIFLFIFPNNQSVDARNNIIMGQNYALVDSYLYGGGTLAISNNWISNGLRNEYDAQSHAFEGSITLVGNITDESDPGFGDPANDDYSLTAGSSAIGAAGPLAPAASGHPVLWQFTPTGGRQARATTDDLGALDYTATVPGNRAPVLDPIANISVTEGEAVVFSPTATDADSNSLSFSYSGWMTSSSYTTQAGDAGTHTVTVTVSDGNGGSDSQDVSVTVNAAVDTVPPIISNIQLSNLTEVSVTVAWQTDEAADSYIEYGLDTGYGSAASNINLATSHTLALTGLSPGTTYHYSVRSQDASANAAASPDATFTTAAPQTYQCNDGQDNDGDSLIDMNDPGCSSATDNDETDTPPPPQNLPAWVDSNSPLAQSLHPRLFLIPDSYRTSNQNAYGITMQEMRDKIGTYYRTEFQDFVSVMDGFYSDDVTAKLKDEISADAMNYAFLYILDPSVMSQAPYSFSFTYSKDEYGQKAREQVLQIAQNLITDTGVHAQDWIDEREATFGNGMLNLAMALVYDWVHPLLTLADKQQIIDGSIAVYTRRSLMETLSNNNGQYLDNAKVGAIQNGDLGAIAAWGDTLDTSGTYYSNQLDMLLGKLKEDFIDRVYDFGNHTLDGSSSWPEGFAYDATMSFHIITPPTGAIGTALGVDYYDAVSYFKEHPLFVLYNVKPLSHAGNYYWYHFDDDHPDKPMVNQSWRTYISGMLQHHIATLPQYASLSKWMRDNSGYFNFAALSNGTTDVRKHYLAHYFLWGDRTVTSQSPSQLGLPLSKKLGLGQIVMRTGFENESDSLVVFNAPKYHHVASHNHYDWAGFTIEKFGNLAIQRSIAKAFSAGNFSATKRSMFYNTIGVYTPGEMVGDSPQKNLMGYRENLVEANLATDAAYQVGGKNHVGTVIAQDLNGLDYDYINYDYSRAWSNPITVPPDGWTEKNYPHKVDYANRDFVYLRSQGGTNDEYVVVLDRVNALDPSYTKHFLLHSSFEPKLLDNSNSAIAMMAENYPNEADGINGGRWVNTTSSPTQDNIIEIINTWSGSHGKLYNKTLLPDSFQINKVGGPGHYWEDAEGRAIYTGTISNTEKNFRGTYSMQIQSTTNQSHDTFLNVMQFGDASTLSAMVPVSKIDAGTMVGAFINDPTSSRVVLFSSDSQGASVSDVTYTIGGSASSEKHLLLEMAPGDYDVYKDNLLIHSSLTVSASGVLAFDSAAGTTYQIVKQ